MLQQITIQNFNEMLNRFTTTELENLLARSPYFQQAHLLLAKKYQLERNPKFDEQLQLAALYTNDRQLFYTIFNQSTPIVEVNKTPLPVQPQIVSVEPEAAETVIEAVSEQVYEPIQEPITNIIVEEQAIDIAVDNVVIEENLDEPTDVIQAEASEPISFTTPHTFDEWLSVFRKNKAKEKLNEEKTEVRIEPIEDAAPDVPAEEMDEELDKMINASVSADYLQQLVQDEKHYSRGLDSFIADQIKRKRQNEARKPAPENEIAPDLVTETLARLYETQKRYAKAIKAYETLSLKFPEKSDLFAARINYLKKLV